MAAYISQTARRGEGTGDRRVLSVVVFGAGLSLIAISAIGVWRYLRSAQNKVDW